MSNYNKLIMAILGLLVSGTSGADPYLYSLMPWLPEWVGVGLGAIATWAVPNGRPVWEVNKPSVGAS